MIPDTVLKSSSTELLVDAVDGGAAGGESVPSKGASPIFSVLLKVEGDSAHKMMGINFSFGRNL
jgi:hypothetical protein